MIVVVAGVIRRGEVVLVARRAPGKHLAGMWEFPGGKAEPGESASESLARELREEFGVDVRVGGFLGSRVHEYPEKTVDLLAYEAGFDGEVHDLVLDSHDEVRWVSVRELGEIELAPADEFIRDILSQRMRVEG